MSKAPRFRPVTSQRPGYGELDPPIPRFNGGDRSTDRDSSFMAVHAPEDSTVVE